MRAAILARVSTEGQAAGDRHSLPFQLSLMTEYVAAKGWSLVATFEIPGESAFKDYLVERPQFASAIGAALRGEFDVLVVYDLTRFARNQAVLHETLRDLRRAGVALMVWSGDWNATEDRTRAGLEGIIAEAHSLQHSARVRQAFERRHELGLPTGDVPFGYRRQESPSLPPLVVEAEAAAVRWAFGAYAGGVGFVEIAEEFNRRGLRPHSKVGYEGFVASSVQRLIESRFYAGMVSHRGSERRGLHEAIVSEEEWEAARNRTRRIRRTEHATALLTGIATCAVCRGPIWTSGWDRRRVNRYYREPSHQQLRECANARTQWVSGEPDGQVAALVRAMGLERDWLAYVERRSRVAPPASANGERAALMEERRRLGELYRAGVYGQAEWSRADAEVRGRLAEVAVEPAQMLLAGAKLEEFAQLWDVASEARRREAVRIVLREVELDTRGKRVEAVHPREGFEGLFAARAAFAGYTPDRGGSRSQQTGYSLISLAVAS